MKFWANEIVRTFPGEVNYTYYRPFHVNSLGQQINAGGKLYFHYHYTLGCLRESGLLKTKNIQSEDINGYEISKSIEEKLTRLSILLDPWSEVVSWPARQNKFESTELKVDEYLNQYACLRIDRAIELYEIDFERLYPNYSTLFIRGWLRVKEYLFQKIKSHKNIKEPSDLGLIHVYPTLTPGK